MPWSPRTNSLASLFKWGKKKTNKQKEFWRDTPWFVSRLSRGHVPSVPRTFCPLNWNFHIHRPNRPGCPWDVPNLSLGRFWGIPTLKMRLKFLYVIFLYRSFFLQIKEVRVFRGFSNVPWRKRAFGSGTKYGF